MNNRNAIFCVVSCVSALTASGCGMIKNLDDMHDATNNMATTTDHMDKQMESTNDQIHSTNTTTDHMATTTDGMAGNVSLTACIAGETYTALRQGNSIQARDGDDALGKMDKANAIETKIFEGAAYMKAFEFQIPNCLDPNAEAYQHEFYMEAAQEFVRVLPNYLTSDKSKWSVSATSTDNQNNDVYALAVALQELNPNVVTAYKLNKWPYKPQSLLDVIQEALSNKTELAAHPEKTTLAEHEILVNEDILVQLMQIRMNFLAAMSLAKVSNLEVKGFLGLPGLVREAKYFFGGWTPNLRQFGNSEDVERLKEYTRYLYGSNDMNAYLKSLGVQPRYDGTIARMYAHMRVGGVVQPQIPNAKTKDQLAFNNTQIELQKYLDQLAIYFGKKKFVKIPELDHPEFYSN